MNSREAFSEFGESQIKVNETTLGEIASHLKFTPKKIQIFFPDDLMSEQTMEKRMARRELLALDPARRN